MLCGFGRGLQREGSSCCPATTPHPIPRPTGLCFQFPFQAVIAYEKELEDTWPGEPELGEDGLGQLPQDNSEHRQQHRHHLTSACEHSENSEIKARMSELSFLTCSEGRKAIWEQELLFSLPHSPRCSFPHTILLVFATVQGKKFCNGTRRWQWGTTESFWLIPAHLCPPPCRIHQSFGLKQPKLLSQSYITRENPGENSLFHPWCPEEA